MREIKFRAWNRPKEFANNMKLGGKMVYAELERIQNYMTNNRVGIFFDCFDVGAPIMQFTGLKDKNGKEIYEGDIANCKDYQNKIYFIGEVYWSDTTAQVYVRCHYNNNPLNSDFSLRIVEDVKEIEVIGNIYENPELLKEG